LRGRVVVRAGRTEPQEGGSIRSFVLTQAGALAWAASRSGSPTIVSALDGGGQRVLDEDASDGTYMVAPAALATSPLVADTDEAQPVYWHGRRCGPSGCAIEVHAENLTAVGAGAPATDERPGATRNGVGP
jgi:hypothetical protein